MSGPVVRLEGQEKVTGKAVFSGDLKLPGLLVGMILRSQVPHARIKKIHTSAARALPGVRAVITGDDFPKTFVGFTIRDEVMMARDKVRYIGEPIAAVAAVDEESAGRALRLIKVELEELPPLFSVEAAMAEGTPLIHENLSQYASRVPLRQYGNVLTHATITRGDVAKAFSESDLIIEDNYSTPVVHQAPLEPRAAVAQVDAGGRLNVWCGTQGPFNIRSGLADTLGLPMSHIRVIGTRVGGAFGGKIAVNIEPIAALLAIKAGQPVKVEMTRQDDFLAANPRHSMRIWVKTGVKRDGTLMARQARITVDTGAYANFGPHTTSQAITLLTGPYYIPNLLLEGLCVYTNKISCGPCRGPGAPQAHLAAETQMDRIARELGIDPFDLRRKNALKVGDRTATGQALSDTGYREVLTRLEESVREQLQTIPLTPEKARGVGIAGCFWGMSGYGSSATVRVNEDGSVILSCGAVDTGAGSDTAMALIVAGELGLPLSRIKVVSGDTDASPFDFGAAGSRTTQAMGVAVSQAVQGVKKQLLGLAGQQLGVPEAELVFGQGKIIARNNPDKALPLAMAATMLSMVNGAPVVATGSNTRPNPPFDSSAIQSHSVPSKPFFVFGAQGVAVDVDKLTGRVEVLKAVSVHDVGKAVYPDGVEGQIQGGVAMGLGYALTEEVVFSEGRPLNPNFLDYRMPTMRDIPEIVPVILEKPAARIPEDIRGVGEPPVIPTAAAVANAVYDAVGVRVNDLPLTPERVYWALKSREARRECPAC